MYSPHQKTITRLYRRALRSCEDWYWQRTEQRQKALIVRELFDSNRFETNPMLIDQYILQTEAILTNYAHYSPYISPTAPGGSKWERNIPVPEEICKRGMTVHDNSS